MPGMDTRTAEILSAATAEFYRRQATSFSATRHAPWRGWVRVLDGLEDALPAHAAVLDVACGNLRFERYLAERFPQVALRTDAVDSCAPLVGCAPAGVIYREADILAALERGNLDEALPVGPYDLVACFGFFHHVPGFDARASLLSALASRLAPQGRLAISFWQFMKSPELALKARESHARGLEMLGRRGLAASQLDEGDWLLGWQDVSDAFRYCHHFTSGEVDELLQASGLGKRVVDRFEADGRTSNLNAYLVIGGTDAIS